MLDLKKNAKTDKQLVEDCLPPYLMYTSLSSLQRDRRKDGKLPAPEWLNMLRVACMVPVRGLPKKRVRMISQVVADIAKQAYRDCGSVTDWSEMMLAVALMITELVKDNQISDVGGQGVLVAALMVDEATTYGDVADLAKARAVAGRLRTVLKARGYFGLCH